MDVAPDKRERILAAASKLIVVNGLQCSMSAIADEAGVATGSLYNYFKSKEDLVGGVYSRVAEAMGAQVVADEDASLPHEARIQRYISAYIDFIWEDAMRARLFEYLDNNPLISITEAQRIFGAFIDHSAIMLDAARCDGVVKDVPPVVMGSFVRGAIRNTLKRRRYGDAVLSAEERRQIAEMCWSAIAADEAG